MAMLPWDWLSRNEFSLLRFLSLFFLFDSVFVPHEVGSGRINTVALHASLDQAGKVDVVWIGREFESSAVIHELFDF